MGCGVVRIFARLVGILLNSFLQRQNSNELHAGCFEGTTARVRISCARLLRIAHGGHRAGAHAKSDELQRAGG
jgi:hypothetical protein